MPISQSFGSGFGHIGSTSNFGAWTVVCAAARSRAPAVNASAASAAANEEPIRRVEVRGIESSLVSSS